MVTATSRSAPNLTGVQKAVLAITGLTFGLMIFSVIPWSSILGATAGPAEYDTFHETAAEDYWWELGWWFPQLSMLFVLSAVLIGLVARMGEKNLIRLINQGVADMIGPAIVIVLARGVAVLLNNTQTLDTVLNAMEDLVSGASAGGFAVLVTLVNFPLAFLIPSSSGHATLAMPLLAPLSEFAGVPRSLTITSFQMGHGLMMLIAPTNVVIVGGLAIAKVGYNRYLRFIAPLFGILATTIAVILFTAATLPRPTSRAIPGIPTRRSSKRGRRPDRANRGRARAPPRMAKLIARPQSNRVDAGVGQPARTPSDDGYRAG
jgi:uncharacterized ion transporter superfamily protein YfcC